MAIALHNVAENSALNGSAITVTHPASMAENDVIVLAFACGDDNVDYDLQITTAGWAANELCDLYSDDTDDAMLAVFWKRMPSSPDATVVTVDTGGGSDCSVAAVEQVWRGVHTTTAIDATTTIDEANPDHTIPDSPSITPATTGAVVISIGAFSLSDTAITPPTNYAIGVVDRNSADTEPITVGMAARLNRTGGTPEDPPVWSGITDTATAAWCAATVALRPVPDPTVITSIDTDNDTMDTSTSVAIVGTTFGASETGSAKVEISNNATYGAGTVVEIDVTAWSDTSITVTLRRESDNAALGTLFTLPLSPAYLWVTSSAGGRNAAGFEFTLRAAPNPGTLPAHVGTEGIAFSNGAALNGTTDKTINITAGAGLQTGDLLLLCVGLYSTDNAGSLNSISSSGWVAADGSNLTYGGAQASRQGVAYHKVTSGEAGGALGVTYNVTAVSGYTFGVVFHFRAADGFAPTPVQAVTPTTSSGSPLGMPTVDPPYGNCRAIAHVWVVNPANTNPAIAEPTGESNGDWTTFDTSGGTTGSLGYGSELETSDQSSGNTISGGTATYTGTGSGVAVGLALVPIDLNAALDATTEPTVGSIVATGFAPTVAASVTAGPSTGATALTGFAPTVAAGATAAPAVGAIGIAGVAPTVSAASLLQPDSGALGLAGVAPSIVAHHTAAPAQAALVGTGEAPTVAANATAEPTAGALTIVGFAPTVSTEAGVSVTPSTAALAVTGIAPSAELGATVAPDMVALALVGEAPTVAASALCEAGAAAVLLAGIAPVATVIQRQLPNTVLAASNLQDTLSNIPPTRIADIDEPADADDTEWWTAVDPAQPTSARVGFTTPAGPLWGQQTIRVLIRGTSLPARDETVELYENGVKLTSEITESVTSDTGQVITLTFQADEVTNPADVEVRIAAAA